MPESAVHERRIAPSAKTAASVSTLLVFECEHDASLVAMPRPEVQIVARFGASPRGGLDVHVLGVRETVRRKLIRRGQRAVTARLHLGTQETVLGVPANEVAGRVVPLEDLWGEAAARALHDALGDARSLSDAAAVLERTVADRLSTAKQRRAPQQLVLDAAERLTSDQVNAVALDLGVSERHLRRVFRETVGVSPKTFARLRRFHRAVQAAREKHHASWASIAASVGYYDQAHLIAEFRAITGVSPVALLGELGAGPLLG